MKRRLRKRKRDDSSEEEDAVPSRLQEIMEDRKLSKKRHGVLAADLVGSDQEAKLPATKKGKTDVTKLLSANGGFIAGLSGSFQQVEHTKAMLQYLEEKMDRKESAEPLVKKKRTLDSDAKEIFSIPEHLKIAERATEALNTMPYGAGIAEVLLPEENPLQAKKIPSEAEASEISAAQSLSSALSTDLGVLEKVKSGLKSRGSVASNFSSLCNTFIERRGNI